MTFSRFVFVFAFLMLLVGAGIGRWLIGPSLGRPPQSGPVLVANAPTATVTAAPRPRRTATRATHRAVAPRPTSTPTPRPTPTSTPPPTPTAVSGTVTLTRYWIGSLEARAGQTISVGYVIDNGTGRTVRLLLGASLKPSRSPSWATGILNDPPHDIVAIVPPGISTHVRFFTVPPDTRSGSYDVAWGLRDALTGQRDALVTAAGVLRVP